LAYPGDGPIRGIHRVEARHVITVAAPAGDELTIGIKLLLLLYEVEVALAFGVRAHTAQVLPVPQLLPTS